MSYRCGPSDWIDLAIGRLEDAKRSLRECDRLRHFLIFQHDQEFFAVDDEIMVGPCSSRDESAHEFGRWKISREINKYNAMKEFLDDARRRD